MQAPREFTRGAKPQAVKIAEGLEAEFLPLLLAGFGARRTPSVIGFIDFALILGHDPTAP